MTFSNRSLFGMSLIVASIYLFVTAPPPLPDDVPVQTEQTYPVKVLFDILAAEQAIARTIYTAQIVGPGIKNGLQFSEQWTDPDVEAGPLPALLLREVSAEMQRNGSNVGLFLGSDFPIATVNQFSNTQQQHFERMKNSGMPVYFFDDSSQMYTAMYVDTASAPPCVSCHNQHPNSPKTDWTLGDPMGATTWLYPKQDVSLSEILMRVQNLRMAIRTAYTSYLDNVQQFSTPVTIGSQWPSDGRFLPDADTFMATVVERSSTTSMGTLLSTMDAR
jgi:hypothetical protein